MTFCIKNAKLIWYMKKLKISKKKNSQIVQDIPIVRYQTDKEHGLSEEQVNERIEHRLVNDTKIKTSNSYLQIFAKNIFTVFNLIWFVIAVALICVNAWSDMLFMLIVIANTAISILQEIKAKKTMERLSMVTTPKIKAIRMGFEVEVKSEDLLLDDIIILENGNQIPADCIIVEGTVEVNESLLTGESNSIKKQEGDTLLAGSFLVSGQCFARVDKVGKNNYIQTVAERTKNFKFQTSNLFKDLNNLIKIIILILVPIGVLTFFKEIYVAGLSVDNAIKSTSGALTGMIPAGMYLLITVGLSVGVIKLARKKTMVKNLFSIEMLARANILCLDKTGTITDGTMNVVDVVNFAKAEHVENVMKVIMASQKTMNATSVALVGRFGKDTNEVAKNVVEFSSQRKFSVTTLKNNKTYYIGAISFIKCAVSKEQKKIMNDYMEQGLRVVGLVEDTNAYNEKLAGKRGKLIAIFALVDHIRKDAVETISWFKENNVQIKIISGDDALTVSKIAKRVGVDGYEKFISLEGMSLQEVAQIADKFTVFGRVTPEQKHTIIKTLKTQGNVVAMTGDGVNDTLALKEANCSIAMADGSEVARNISHLVLMESNFSALPAIVKEGRQIVNNVQHSSVLYLMKTLFTILLCTMTLVLGISYPFTPKQLLLTETFVIGIPSFILTFQPNSELIRGNFIPQVLKKSIPCAILMFLNVLIVLIMNDHTATLDLAEYQTLSTLVLTYTAFVNLVWVCWPLNWLKAAVVVISFTLIGSAIAAFGKLFLVTSFTFPVLTTLITLILCCIVVVMGIYYLKSWYVSKYRIVQPDGTVYTPSVLKILWEKLKHKQKAETEDTLVHVEKTKIDAGKSQKTEEAEAKNTEKNSKSSKKMDVQAEQNNKKQSPAQNLKTQTSKTATKKVQTNSVKIQAKKETSKMPKQAASKKPTQKVPTKQDPKQAVSKSTTKSKQVKTQAVSKQTQKKTNVKNKK